SGERIIHILTHIFDPLVPFNRAAARTFPKTVAPGTHPAWELQIGRRRRQPFDFAGNRQGKCLEFLGISLEKFGISLEELGFSLERLGKIWSSWTRHARPCAGHPRRAAAAAQASPDSNPAAWMAGTSPAMTGDRTGIGLPIYPP
ncbi:MAG: hypothetical protein ABSA66_20950, partial [Roseiarcus sp.]